jgi:hypothetical protein
MMVDADTFLEMGRELLVMQPLIAKLSNRNETTP